MMRRMRYFDFNLPQGCLRDFDSCQSQQFMCLGKDSAIRHRQLPLQMRNVHAAMQARTAQPAR